MAEETTIVRWCFSLKSVWINVLFAVHYLVMDQRFVCYPLEITKVQVSSRKALIFVKNGARQIRALYGPVRPCGPVRFRVAPDLP